MIWDGWLHENNSTVWLWVGYIEVVIWVSWVAISINELEADRISFYFYFSVPEKARFLFFGWKRYPHFRFFSFFGTKMAVKTKMEHDGRCLLLTCCRTPSWREMHLRDWTLPIQRESGVTIWSRKIFQDISYASNVMTRSLQVKIVTEVKFV